MAREDRGPGLADRARPADRRAGLLLGVLAGRVPRPPAGGWGENALSHNDRARAALPRRSRDSRAAMDKIVYSSPTRAASPTSSSRINLGRSCREDTAGSAQGSSARCGHIEDLVSAFPGDPFWIVSFNAQRGPRAERLIDTAGRETHTDLAPPRLTMGTCPRRALPLKPPGARGGRDLPERRAWRRPAVPGAPQTIFITLMLNDAEKPRTPTVFFPVCTAPPRTAALERARGMWSVPHALAGLAPVGNPSPPSA